MEVYDIFLLILKAVVSAAIVVAIRFIISALKRWIETTDEKELADLVKTLVEAAEQTWREQPCSGELKKQDVMDYILSVRDLRMNFCGEPGSEKEKKAVEKISRMVESEVYRMNLEKKKVS